MVKFSPRVGIDGRDMAAFNDRVVRRQFFRRVSDRCASMRESIKALRRKPAPNALNPIDRLRIISNPYLALHTEICQIWTTLEGIRSRRLAVPDEVKHEVFSVKTLLEEILSKLGISCSQT